MSAPGFVDEDTLDDLRLRMTDMLQSDAVDDEEEIEYLLEYGTKRAGVTSPQEFSGWLRSAYRTSAQHLKGRTLGSPAKDVAYVLRLMERVDAGSPR